MTACRIAMIGAGETGTPLLQQLIDAPLFRYELANGERRVRVSKDGKPSKTDWKVVERFKTATLVHASPLSGRTHQIRVHMAYIGHPLLGDPCYSKCRNILDKKITGQALHSHTLKLYHPITGREMSFTAPLPDDMKHLLDILRNKNGSEN